MMLAFYMSKYDKQITTVKVGNSDFKYGVFYPALIFGAICMLVALEKHISGLMIIGMIGIAVMYMGGTRTKWIFLIIGAIAVAGCLLILVSDYAQDRVNTWLNIDKVDPLGSAWQTLQGLYAIGSGGLFGVGLGNSRQKYGYVSQPQNDFVFTIICEELGFFGAALVVVMFSLLVIRGFKIAARCPDKYTSLLVFGLTFKVALQTILNIAVVTNSMPNTGISLPFFSSGGTSLALQIFEMGIILNISRFSTVKKG
jgi:cell division protein FtsW